METTALACPNCSAPLKVPLGETETGCDYCGSRLRLLPGQSELEVVRTREEMKRKERVEVQRLILQQRLQQEELEKWRAMAGRVAIAALPVVGRSVARAAVSAALSRNRGCLPLVGLVVVAAAGVAALFR